MSVPLMSGARMWARLSHRVMSSTISSRTGRWAWHRDRGITFSAISVEKLSRLARGALLVS